MGVLYSAFPVNRDIRAWLADMELPVPESDGHTPTPSQLVTALKTLINHKIEFNVGAGVWQAYISDSETGAWTVLNILDYTESDEPCEFYFAKGYPVLVIKIIHRISQDCGPIAVVPNIGYPITVVEPNSDINYITNSWAHITR